MAGVALKVTYNDGGPGTSRFGYCGICTNPTMLYNVKLKKRPNCKAAESPCRQYVDNQFKGRRPTNRSLHCYESRMLANTPLTFGFGLYHRGQKIGQPMPVQGVAPGDMAFLTTKFPEAREEERVVFGCFRVAKEPFFEEGWGYVLQSDGTIDLVFPDDVASRILFWNYCTNKDGSTRWDSGLHRHLKDTATADLLSDAFLLLEGTDERETIASALGEVPKRRNIRPSSGFRHGFGGGGEGEAHRRLKEFVARHPEKIGLPKRSKANVEYLYGYTNDRVDIMFELPNGDFATVEIETTTPLPGAYQCIKYKALLEAEKGYEQGSKKVRSILVAYDFDAETKRFAKRYGIKLAALKPD